MLTILVFRPETRTYLPFEINLQNMKYIPLHMRRASSYPTFLGDIFNYVN